jgi:hypothetical protein
LKIALITIDASDLKKELEALAEFLESKLQISITIKNKMLVIDDSKVPIRTRDVKTHLKQFIHYIGLSEEYRVTVDHSVIRILKVESHKPSKHGEEGTVPHPADTMPWYFPWKT